MDWDEADLFTVPLLDGASGVGQVVEVLSGGALVVLTSRRGEDGGQVAGDEIVALLRVPREPLDSGQWPIGRLETLPRPRTLIEPRHAPDDLQDPAVVEAFLSACHGLLPWDYFPGDVFDRLLYPGRERPASAR